MRIRFDPDARLELFDQSDFYEERRTGYGLRFIEVVSAATEAAALSPGAGVRWQDSPPGLEIYRRRVPGFPMDWLVYTVLGGDLYIVAVIHTRRLPGTWVNRLDRIE